MTKYQELEKIKKELLMTIDRLKFTASTGNDGTSTSLAKAEKLLIEVQEKLSDEFSQKLYDEDPGVQFKKKLNRIMEEFEGQTGLAH